MYCLKNIMNGQNKTLNNNQFLNNAWQGRRYGFGNWAKNVRNFFISH